MQTYIHTYSTRYIIIIHEMPATFLLKYTKNKQNHSVKSALKDAKHTQARRYKNNNDEHLSQCCLRPSL